MISRASHQTIKIISNSNNDVSKGFVNRVENVDEGVINSALCIDVMVLDEENGKKEIDESARVLEVG